MIPDIHVAIKSYKRAGRVTTLVVVPFASIWIPESQKEEYLQYYPEESLVTIPDELDGNLCRKQNAMFDLAPSEWILILDDDISGIGRFDDGNHKWMDPEEIREFILQGFILANDVGAKMWGVNQNNDPLAYRTYSPFNFLAPVLGPFHGHLSPELRFDEEMDLKEDYDFYLRNIVEYRKVLRLNKYHYKHDHGKMPGGQVSMRTLEREQNAITRMRKRWGDEVFKEGGAAHGGGAKGDNILNSLVKVPIPGH